MNTTGWVRGLISHNTTTREYIDFITDTLAKEFNSIIITDEDKENFVIGMGDYHITINKDTAKTLQMKSPYSLDKHILERLREQ